MGVNTNILGISGGLIMELNDIINDTTNELISQKSALDQNQKSTVKYESIRKDGEKSGRKNKGITNKNYDEFLEEYKEYKREVRSTPNYGFNDEIIEHVKGEIVEKDNIEEFQEMYLLTCEQILEQFKEDNAELVKKHPYNWHKQLLIKIKSNTPKLSIEDIDKLGAVWECLSVLLFNIGLYPTFEIFSLMTNTYKEQYLKRKELNPKYGALLEKIFNDSKNALISELSTNPYNQTNKIFLAKSIYGLVEKNEPKQIEVHHDIRNYDNLPMFNDSRNEKSV